MCADRYIAKDAYRAVGVYNAIDRPRVTQGVTGSKRDPAQLEAARTNAITAGDPTDHTDLGCALRQLNQSCRLRDATRSHIGRSGRHRVQIDQHRGGCRHRSNL